MLKYYIASTHIYMLHDTLHLSIIAFNSKQTQHNNYFNVKKLFLTKLNVHFLF